MKGSRARALPLPSTVTLSAPERAPATTSTASSVSVARSTRSRAAPRVTVLREGSGSKPVPVSVTVSPTSAARGSKRVRLTGWSTEKSTDDATGPTPAAVTCTRPVTAPWGTVTTSSLGATLTTVAGRSPKVTCTRPASLPKCSPRSTTRAPGAARGGSKVRTTGAGPTKSRVGVS
jgi:hypothetical protein